MRQMHCLTEKGLHINSCNPEAVAEQVVHVFQLPGLPASVPDTAHIGSRVKIFL